MSQMLKGRAVRRKGEFYLSAVPGLTERGYGESHAALAYQQDGNVGQVHNLGRNRAEEQAGARIQPAGGHDNHVAVIGFCHPRNRIRRISDLDVRGLRHVRALQPRAGLRQNRLTRFLQWSFQLLFIGWRALAKQQKPRRDRRLDVDEQRLDRLRKPLRQPYRFVDRAQRLL